MAYSKRVVALLGKELGIEDRGPNSIDIVVDASGAETSIQMGLLIVRRGGTYIQVGDLLDAGVHYDHD